MRIFPDIVSFFFFSHHPSDLIVAYVLGVLTKPDTLQEGEERNWFDIIEGRKHQLALGYFVTKQPSPKDVEKGISHQDARMAERDFFNNHPIWSACTSLARDRMGTKRLGASLSTLLSRLIDDTYVILYLAIL